MIAAVRRVARSARRGYCMIGMLLVAAWPGLGAAAEPPAPGLMVPDHELTACSKRILRAQYVNLLPRQGAKELPWEAIRVFSPDDPEFAEGRAPVGGSVWLRPLRFALRPPENVRATWLFLIVDRDLTAGKVYEVRFAEGRFLRLDAATGQPLPGDEAPPPVWMRWLGDRHPSPALQVNQVGYLPDGPKFAYLTQYAGRQFGLDRSADLNFSGFTQFNLIDAKTDQAVHQGRIQPAEANRRREQHRADQLTRSRVWEMDFRNWQRPGRYRIEVPGVGSSLPFVIAPNAYHQVLGVLCRGMLHQRCGTELAAPWTRHPHPACHLGDARIPATSEYGREDLLFFAQKEGVVGCAGGHHVGGQYEKATIPSALFAFRLLLPFEVMPGRLNYLACPVPESEDTIPDLIQEAKRALDWLLRMQDDDGGFFSGVWPEPTTRFEFGLAGEAVAGAARSRVVAWKDVTATAAAAAALARAARLPEFREAWPEEARRYRERAEKAWDFCLRQIDERGAIRWVDGSLEGSFLGATDELCWLAAELWLAAGRPECHEFFLRQHRPDDGWRWGWWPLAEASGAATRAYAFGQRGDANPDMREACRAAVLRAARETAQWQEDWAFRTSFPEELHKGGRWAWYFLSDIASYDLLLAAALSEDQALARKFRQAALHNVDQELGNVPAGVTAITGIGSRRATDLVHQLTRNGAVVEPVPGMPLGFPASGFTRAPDEQSLLSAQLPEAAPTAYRQIDGWNVEREFSLPVLAATVMVYAMLGDPARQRPGFPELKVTANGQSERLAGPAPLTVAFRGAAAGQHGKLIREWYWDLGDGAFCRDPDFTYTYARPGEYRAACTVTDDDGWPAFREVFIRVQPAKAP